MKPSPPEDLDGVGTGPVEGVTPVRHGADDRQVAGIGIVVAGRIDHRRAGQLDGAQHVGQQVLHRLERADRPAEGVPLLGVGRRQDERLLGAAQGVGDEAQDRAVERRRQRRHGVDVGDHLGRGRRQLDPGDAARRVHAVERVHLHIGGRHGEHAVGVPTEAFTEKRCAVAPSSTAVFTPSSCHPDAVADAVAVVVGRSVR